jgi:hypothetical protein
MSNRLYPCSVSDPLGEGTNSELLGQGALPWPNVIAERHFPTGISISGFYATDELSAAHFMVATLSDPDNGMDTREHEQMALHLSYLISKITLTGDISAIEVKELNQKASSISAIGEVILSISNMPGELATLAGILHATTKSTQLSDLLDLPPQLKRQLANWANTRGKPGSISAKRAFKGRIKLVRLRGQLYFEVPANARAQLFQIEGRAGANALLIPLHQVAQALRNKAPITSRAYGSRGIGRVLTSPTSSSILALGPQAIIDISESNSTNEFLSRSAYTQSGNILSIGAGIVIGVTFSSAVVVLGITLATGIAIQVLMNIGEHTLNDRLGDLLTGANR